MIDGGSGSVSGLVLFVLKANKLVIPSAPSLPVPAVHSRPSNPPGLPCPALPAPAPLRSRMLLPSALAYALNTCLLLDGTLQCHVTGPIPHILPLAIAA
ncbi:hypothetical protein C8F01DRAFT_1252759 [Mycena amicta]|nr:hypothetical protein C8F01DRAFT_1252759 [Mycena amicta]